MNEPIDPVCLIHGKKRSEHQCLYCCLCYVSLTLEQCNINEQGQRENVCVPCATQEKQQALNQKRL